MVIHIRTAGSRGLRLNVESLGGQRETGRAHSRNVECVCARTEPLLRHHHSNVHGGWSTASHPPLSRYYQEEVGIFSIDPVELIAGSLPKRQRRLVEAWAELHQQELMADWETLQQGKTPVAIEPLK